MGQKMSDLIKTVDPRKDNNRQTINFMHIET